MHTPHSVTRGLLAGLAAAGLALAGLAGGALAATDPPDNSNSSPSVDAAQGPDQGAVADQQEPAAAAVRGAAGGWDGPGGPQARRMGPHHWGRPPVALAGHGFGRPTLDRPLLLAFRRLELSDAQWQRVQAILEVQHLRRGADDTGATPEQRRAQLAALFNPGDPQHGAAVQAMKDRATARIDQDARTQQALYEVLTPAQKDRLQQLIAQHLERLRSSPPRESAEPDSTPVR